MLVLSRKRGQSVQLAELDVAIHVVSVRGSRVQLGIEAPRDITVIRPEKADCRACGQETRHDEANGMSEANRLDDDLSRIEAALAALGEMVDDKSVDEQDANVARQLAADSIERLGSIRRSMRLCRKPKDERPISELVKVRTDVLQRLRQQRTGGQPTPKNEAASWPNSSSASCIRESSTRYAAGSVA